MENGQWVEHWNESRIRPRQFQYVDGEEIPYYYMEKERADILLEFLAQAWSRLPERDTMATALFPPAP
mgnify:CR=1 FL=1